MSEEGHVPNPPSAKRLLILTGVAFAVAAAVTIGFVAPAEFHFDPLGVGKLTGLDRLAGPKEVAVKPAAATAAGAPATPARNYPAAFRTDVIEIPLPGDGADGSELEYKVRMRPGSTLVYSWTEAGTPAEEFYSDFHGQTIPATPKGEIQVATYRQSTGASDNGSLIAPLDGVHGWYLQNQGLKAAKVTLRLAGFYELVPPGQLGNEAGITPRPLAP